MISTQVPLLQGFGKLEGEAEKRMPSAFLPFPEPRAVKELFKEIPQSKLRRLEDVTAGACQDSVCGDAIPAACSRLGSPRPPSRAPGSSCSPIPTCFPSHVPQPPSALRLPAPAACEPARGARAAQGLGHLPGRAPAQTPGAHTPPAHVTPHRRERSRRQRPVPVSAGQWWSVLGTYMAAGRGTAPHTRCLSPTLPVCHAPAGNTLHLSGWTWQAQTAAASHLSHSPEQLSPLPSSPGSATSATPLPCPGPGLAVLHRDGSAPRGRARPREP